MTSRRPYWCPKPVLWELNFFLMQTLSFVPINLHRCWLYMCQNDEIPLTQGQALRTGICTVHKKPINANSIDGAYIVPLACFYGALTVPLPSVRLCLYRAYVEPIILPSWMLHRGRKASALITKKCTGKIYK